MFSVTVFKVATLPFGALDPDWTSLAVQVSTEIGVVLQLAMGWQNLLETPLVVAQRRPFIEIGGHPADRDRGINGRTSARYFPSVLRKNCRAGLKRAKLRPI